MLDRGLNAPETSSVGRLFDAVASLAGVRQVSRHEGQAAMWLEGAIEPGAAREKGYAFAWRRESQAAPEVLDWAPMLEQLLDEVRSGVGSGLISARFHHGLVEAIVAMACRAGQERVVLAGGCFQNRYLLERTVGRLREAGFRPYWPQRVPPNDGGIALGQVVVARSRRWASRDAAEEGMRQ
jgi:hydrogenase maturation protein HypF